MDRWPVQKYSDNSEPPNRIKFTQWIFLNIVPFREKQLLDLLLYSDWDTFAKQQIDIKKTNILSLLSSWITGLIMTEIRQTDIWTELITESRFGFSIRRLPFQWLNTCSALKKKTNKHVTGSRLKLKNHSGVFTCLSYNPRVLSVFH